MKKKITVIVLAVIGVSWMMLFQYPKLYIATGYGAKCLASGLFVAGRQPQEILDQDLNYSIVKYTTSKIDYQNKTVQTSYWGFFPQTALFREGLGCCLTNGIPIDSLRKTIIRLPQPSVAGLWQVPWPKGDLVKDTVFAEINKSKLDSVLNSAFDEKKRTAAVVVLYKGELVGEKYWKEKGITPDTRLWGWSMNKSIVNALIGILVKQGRMDVNASAPIAEWNSDRRRDITIKDLMHMNSGLKWNEDYGTVSDVTDMLYRQKDVYKASIRAPYQKAPEMIWLYSTGSANVLSGIIRGTIHNDKEYYSFPYKELFYKTGMYSMVLESDAAGNFVGGSYGYATPRDWARFGLLYSGNGVWQGDTILPKGWVDFTRKPAKFSKGKYGALFWLNKSHQLPDAPEDTYFCDGHRGQMVIIVPSRELVIVRLGFSKDYFNTNQFVKGILSSIKPPL